MISLAVIGLSALLKVATPPQTLFASKRCGYQVTFPQPVQVVDAPAPGGGQNISAELVRENIRFAASCLISSSAPARAGDVIERISRALGVQEVKIQLSRELGPECADVQGRLTATYVIEAKLCVSPNATFIAETIYPDGPRQPIAAQFLGTVSRKPPSSSRIQ